MEHLVRTMAIAVVVMMVPAPTLVAQTADDPGRHVALHVDDLSNAERDAIALDLSVTGEFRISYACVPAGILVIERIDAPMQETDRSRAENLVRQHIHASTATRTTASLTDLEEQCMTARDQ